MTNTYSQRESFPLNCRSIVPFQKYKYPRYPSSVGRLVSFYYFQGRRKRSDHSDLGRTKILTFAVKVLYFQNFGRTNNCLVEAFSNGRTNLALLPPPLTFIYKEALSRLKCKCRSSPPVQISRSPAFSSSVSLLVSFCFLFPQRASFILNYRSSLPVQISKKPGYSSSESFFVSFCRFYSVKVLFPLNCRSSLSVHVSRKLGYWTCNRL